MFYVVSALPGAYYRISSWPCLLFDFISIFGWLDLSRSYVHQQHFRSRSFASYLLKNQATTSEAWWVGLRGWRLSLCHPLLRAPRSRCQSTIGTGEKTVVQKIWLDIVFKPPCWHAQNLRRQESSFPFFIFVFLAKTVQRSWIQG